MLKSSVNAEPRGPIWVLLFALSSIYAFAAFGLANQMHFGTAVGEAGASQHADSTAPDDVVARVASSLQSVIGADDELVILPARDGTGYTVTANVTLDSRSSAGDDWKPAVEKDIDAYFTDLYAQTQPIEDAQIFFLVDGRLVAGAGLGKEAYRQMNSSVSTSSEDNLVESLSVAPIRTDSGNLDSWMEIEQ